MGESIVHAKGLFLSNSSNLEKQKKPVLCRANVSKSWSAGIIPRDRTWGTELSTCQTKALSGTSAAGGDT